MRLVFGFLVAMMVVGCGSNQTETGYTPKKLSMSGTQLRALYAPAFTPESHVTEDTKPDTGGIGHR